MTVTPSDSLARRRVPRAAAGLVAILTLLTTLLTPTGAFADTPTPEPTPTPPIAVGTTAFTLAPISNGLLPAGESLNVSLTLQNETDASTPRATAVVSLGRTALADRAALTAWLDGDTSGVRTQRVATAELEPVAPASSHVTAARVDGDARALTGLDAGVYPLRATYDAPEGPVTATSVFIVPPADQTEVGIGVLVPITAETTAGGLLTAEQLTALTAPDGSLTAQLDGVEGTTAILAVDPAIPAAIRVLGTAAPESALLWLERLDSLPNSRFALQFGDADVAAQLESGLSRPLRPTSLSAYMTPADFIPVPEATPEPTPTPAVDPEAPVYPSLSELLDVGPATRNAVYWPADGTAGSAVVEQLGDIRISDQSALTVVSSAQTAAGAKGATVPAHGRTGDAEVLVYDADVSQSLSEASRRDETSLRGASLAAATAYLAFATAETGGAPLLVTLGRDAARSRVSLGATIDAASGAPGVSPLTIGGLANSTTTDVKIGDAAVEQVRADAASALVNGESELSRFATILDEPGLITGPERAEILQLLGIAWMADGEGWTTALADHRATTAETLDAVGLVPTPPISLYGANAGLQFWVRNDLEWPVNLVLYVTPDDLRLDVQRANPVVAQPRSNSRVEVPVQARVGNGEVTLDLQLRSRASVAIGEPESVDVSVRAEWETFGIAALAILVGGLLLLGVVRTVLRLRARRRGTDAAAPADGDADGPSADGGEEDGPRADAADGAPEGRE